MTIYSIPTFNIDSEGCPKQLRIVLREQIRQVFSLRRETSTITLSNKGLDDFIDSWWENHQNIIRAASIRPEFNWSTLSLNFNEDVMRPVNLYEASKDYMTLLARPNSKNVFNSWHYSADVPLWLSDGSTCFDMCSLGLVHQPLIEYWMAFFKHLVLEDKVISESTEYTNKDAKLSVDKVTEIKAKVDASQDEDHKSKFCKKLQSSGMLGEDFIPFNKIPQKIYEKYINGSLEIDFFDTFLRFINLEEVLDLFYAEIYKAVGAHQLNGGEGPLKTTIVNKLIKQYYNWLTALSIGTSGNPSALDVSFDDAVKALREKYKFYSEAPLKQRTEGVEGFEFTNYISYEQCFARLQEEVKGCLVKQSFIVSFHPCDMITCSFGYNWSSCQSFVNILDNFPRTYSNGSTYSGMYNRGNFQFASGNAFIAYIPYETRTDLPQYLWAKLKRCLIWVGNNLDCMRQNYFYPGKPSDQETLAFAKVIREYIQDICAPFNFSNGTMDWKGISSSVRYCSQVNEEGFEGFNEIYCSNNGVRYDDPILRVAYLKTSKNRSLVYAKDFKCFDTTKRTNVFRGTSSDVCPICGKPLKDDEEIYCSKCSKELVTHNGIQYHKDDLIKLNIDGKETYYSLDEFDKLKDVVITEEGTAVNFKNAFKVLMPHGYKYFNKLPDYVKQCKVCNEYFHPSFMVGDVCINHVNTILNDSASKIDYDEVINSFLHNTLSFACNNTEALTNLLADLNAKAIKWVSGKKANEFVPSSEISKGKFLCCKRNKLVLTSQANTPVIELSKLLQRKEA